MTIIAAVKQDGKIWMGADSASVNSNGHIMTVAGGKIVWRGEMLIGVSGSARWLHLIRHSPLVPEPPPDCDMMAWFVQDFTAAFREIANSQGLIQKDDHQCDEINLNMLIACRGEIYATARNFEVVLVTRDFHAIGSGCCEAAGALYALRDKSPSNRLLTALEACAELLQEIRAPFYVETLE